MRMLIFLVGLGALGYVLLVNSLDIDLPSFDFSSLVPPPITETKSPPQPKGDRVGTPVESLDRYKASSPEDGARMRSDLEAWQILVDAARAPDICFGILVVDMPDQCLGFLFSYLNETAGELVARREKVAEEMRGRRLVP